MGTDNLQHKRKAKKTKDHQRRIASRQPYDRVLIVCEGQKTEPFYFEELRKYYNLHSTNIKITGNCDSSPTSILKKAEELFDDSKKERNPFDKVYCVFDRDDHSCYQEVINRILAKKPQGTFFAITSTPCFEYWLLLHFECRTAPFQSSGNRSMGDNVVKELKKHIPNYHKGSKDIFSNLMSSLDHAIHNADRIIHIAQGQEFANPSTLVHELVKYLKDLHTKS